MRTLQRLAWSELVLLTGTTLMLSTACSQTPCGCADVSSAPLSTAPPIPTPPGPTTTTTVSPPLVAPTALSPIDSGAPSAQPSVPSTPGVAEPPDMTGAPELSGSATPTAPPAEPEPALGPTPADTTANFPFPQNRSVGPCTLPSNFRNSDVLAAFDKWKADTVTSDGAGGHLRVKRLESDPVLELGSTVSEGIAYGMMIAVYMNDQTLFDELWKYSQLWVNENGLMHWYINAAGTEVLGSGAASDADEDIAWALVMADRQWGGSGTLSDTYLDTARYQIDLVWQHEVIDGKLMTAGDSWGGWGEVNVSYFAPSYYRTFADVTGNAGWNDVVQTTYDTLANSLRVENGNSENGLVPAWCTSDGEPNNNVWNNGEAPTHYQYDSCRTPFRIGLDYCLHSEPRALDYVAKTSGFFSGVGVPNIVDGYDLDGTPRPQFTGGQSAAFIGPAAVGAMHSTNYQAFLDEAYSAVASLDLLVGGAYYDESWTVISLLMLTGNFLDYTQLEPVRE